MDEISTEDILRAMFAPRTRDLGPMPAWFYDESRFAPPERRRASLENRRSPGYEPEDVARQIGDDLRETPGVGLAGVLAQLVGLGAKKKPLGNAPAGKDTQPANRRLQTVRDPYRMRHPGIYGNPREMAKEAASRVAPESPALKRVFGVTREDLAAINLHGRRAGALEPEDFLKGYVPKGTPRGSVAAENVMTPRNEQRLLDILGEAGKHRSLRVGMDNWYVMDAVHRRLVQLFGEEEGAKRFLHLQAMMGMASPGSNVGTEIRRGLAAHYLDAQGRFRDFARYGGQEARLEAATGVEGVPGHAFHSTAQAPPMGRYIASGRRFDNAAPGTVKTLAYINALGVPQTGFQTRTPVGDAHYSRAVGLGDTRKGPSGTGSEATMEEMRALTPWWQKKIASQIGIQPVPAQGRLWGAASGQTGVDTPIGAPKIELLAEHIVRRARQLGISPAKARDLILSGKLYSAPAAAAAATPAILELMRQMQPRPDDQVEDEGGPFYAPY